MNIKIQRLKAPEIGDVRDINILLPQQADKPHLLTLKELRRVTAQSCIEIYVARAKIGKREL